MSFPSRSLLQKIMTRSVSLHPSFFGKNFQQTLERKLKADCEGVWSEMYGFIVLVADVTSFGKGKVQDETGHAVFTLKFNALVFRVRMLQPWLGWLVAHYSFLGSPFAERCWMPWCIS